MSEKEEKYVELPEHRAMVMLPENAVQIQIIAKVFEDGDIQNVSMTYDLSDIREMFRKADEGYIDENDRFVLTDKGRAYLEELERSRE